MSKEIYDNLVDMVDEAQNMKVDRSNPTYGNLPVRFINANDPHDCYASRICLRHGTCGVCGKRIV